MIVNKYSNGGDKVTPEQVQQDIQSALTPYWDSATTESAISEAISGISFEGYATSEDVQSAFTLISETQQAAEAGFTKLEARIDELSGSSPDLSAYYTSAQTESAIEVALAGYSPDLSAYYTSAQTESAIEEALSTISVDLTPYWTSAETQVAIDEAMTAYTPTTGFSTINGSAITNGGNLVIESTSVDLSGYYTSAQTEEAISAATSGKADAANVSAVSSGYHIPKWNDEGVITGETGQLYSKWFSINGINRAGFMSNYDYNFGPIFAPEVVGTAGDILVSTGNGAPVWSAVTFPDLSAYYTSAQTENAIGEAMTAYTPTTGFSTINGSAITNGGNLVIESTSVDLSGYYTSAQTESAIEEAIAGVSVDLSAYWTSAQTQSAITAVEDHLYDVEHVTASALTELHDGLVEVSGRTVDMSNYYTAPEVDNAISVATRDMVTSTSVSTIWKGTQAEYDAIATKDPNTFYIIL